MTVTGEMERQFIDKEAYLKTLEGIGGHASVKSFVIKDENFLIGAYDFPQVCIFDIHTGIWHSCDFIF